MFSGKTDAIIARFQECERSGVSVIAIKPARDTRHEPTSIVSHSGRKIPAHALEDVSAFAAATHQRDCVVIDEIQFFPTALSQALVDLREQGKRVVAAGLDLDFRRTPFETTHAVEMRASRVLRLAATCGLCGAGAPFTQRISDGQPADLSDSVLRVGDSGLYAPRCGRCWEAERSTQKDF